MIADLILAPEAAQDIAESFPACMTVTSDSYKTSYMIIRSALGSLKGEPRADLTPCTLQIPIWLLYFAKPIVGEGNTL